AAAHQQRQRRAQFLAGRRGRIEWLQVRTAPAEVVLQHRPKAVGGRRHVLGEDAADAAVGQLTQPRQLLFEASAHVPNDALNYPVVVRALELTGFDGPASLSIAERPEPQPGPREVRVRLKTSALNHLDVFITRGLPKRP